MCDLNFSFWSALLIFGPPFSLRGRILLHATIGLVTQPIYRKAFLKLCLNNQEKQMKIGTASVGISNIYMSALLARCSTN